MKQVAADDGRDDMLTLVQ